MVAVPARIYDTMQRLFAKIPSGLTSLAATPQGFDPMLLISRDLTTKRFRMPETQMRN
jgi:hypothetical protein